MLPATSRERPCLYGDTPCFARILGPLTIGEWPRIAH